MDSFDAGVRGGNRRECRARGDSQPRSGWAFGVDTSTVFKVVMIDPSEYVTTALPTPPARFFKSWWVGVAEVAGVVVGLLALQWIPWGHVSRDVWWRTPLRTGLTVAVVAMVVFSFVRRGERLADLGLAPRQWSRGWQGMALYTGCSLVVLAGLGFYFGQPQWDAGWLLKYVGGMIGQQLALQCFLNNRVYYFTQGMGESRRITWAVVGSTLAFALLHAPNWWLMALVIPSGLAWTLNFRLHRNLFAVMASHLVLGAATMLLLGQGPLLRLRVGWPAWESLRGY